MSNLTPCIVTLQLYIEVKAIPVNTVIKPLPTLKVCGQDHTPLEELASDRDDWRETVRGSIVKAKEDCIGCLVNKRMRCKARGTGLAGSPT